MTDTKEAAQDAIISAICIAAFKAEDEGELDLATEIRREGTRLAKRYGLSEVGGLPDTWPKTKRPRTYKRL